jgi:Rieske Fe-S protein
MRGELATGDGPRTLRPVVGADLLSRRDFLGASSCALAVLVVEGCASLVAHPVPLTDGVVELPLARYPELRDPLGALAIQPPGFTDPVYVLSASNGEVRALSPICTHRGCTVEVEGERLVCPCHGSVYDREGRVLRGPAERSLTRFTARLAGDRLVIDFRSAP